MDFVGEMLKELDRAKKHGKFHSLHEAYAVILEEVDELWEIVRRKREDRDSAALRQELIQIAAMAYKASLSLGLESGIQVDGYSHPDCAHKLG